MYKNDSMAPKKAKNPGKSARYYRKNPEAYAKKLAYDTKSNKDPKDEAYRRKLAKKRRSLKIMGKGGPDLSHTRDGRLVKENPKTNRARNGAGGRRKKK